MDIDSRMGTHEGLETLPPSLQQPRSDMGGSLLRGVPGLLPHEMNIEDLQHMLSKISTMKLDARGDIRKKVLELEHEVKLEMKRISRAPKK